MKTVNRLGLIQYTIDTANSIKLNDEKILSDMIQSILDENLIKSEYQAYLDDNSGETYQEYLCEKIYNYIKYE